MCFLYCFDMSSMGVCTTRHKQTFGRLVQEIYTSIYNVVVRTFDSAGINYIQIFNIEQVIACSYCNRSKSIMAITGQIELWLSIDKI